MDLLRFAELVDRVEHEAEAHPKRYLYSVLGLAVLGFVAMGGALVLALLTAAVSVFVVIKAPALIQVMIKLIWIPVAMTFALAKALFARTPPPEGLLVTPREAPALFEVIERVRAATGSMPMHHVVITPEFNAFAAEIPRLGPFFVRRYLGLGLPLLQGMPPEEVEAVIAHEFGHFSNRHGRVGAYIYRLRRMWSEMERAANFGVLNKFLSWYAPYFNAYTFVMARRHEYVADQAAAGSTGAPVVARALCRSAVLGTALEESFWGRFGERTLSEPEAPKSLFRDIANFVRTAASSQSLEGPMRRVTGHDDRIDLQPSAKSRPFRSSGTLPPASGSAPLPVAWSRHSVRSGVNEMPRPGVTHIWNSDKAKHGEPSWLFVPS
ncbi:MAG: M48 family metallopeptidase [Ahniella sp.]|nr:M48 family metallopeptidase [Ahniella sp.]